MSAPRKTWQAVHAAVLDNIESRRWRPGDRIPDETDLADTLGCARSTVNRALRELASAGVLNRKRKGGTHVASDPARRVVGEIPITRLDVEASGQAYSFTLLERRTRPLPRQWASQLQVDVGTKAHYLVTLHHADNKAVVLERRWINMAAVPGIADQCFEHISVNEWLVREVAFTSGTLTLQAASADKVTARQLGVEPGAALFSVQRITRTAQQWITAAELRHAPGYSLELSL